MAYRLRITATAQSEILRLPGHLRQRARRVVSELAEQPRPRGAKGLRGLPNRYRLWLNSWRIIYRVDEADKVVLIVRVRHKEGPDTYAGLEIDDE